MWPSRRSLRGRGNRGRKGEGRGKEGGKKLGGLGRGERERLPQRDLYGRRSVSPLPEPPHFFSLPSLPLPFLDVLCELLFFRIKMASAEKRSRTVSLSAERVLESLEQKGDGNDSMSSGEESDLYQLQHTIERSKYKLS